MKRKSIIIIISISLAAVSALWFSQKTTQENWQEIIVKKERFLRSVSESGTIQPENKITVNAPIAGRIEKILVEEGTKVKRGQVIAWMSSTDRAALLDSASSQGDAAVKEMMDVYKPTPIVSPMTGVVITRSIVVGQSVSLTTGLFDLSDRLVIIADVDETDLAKVYLGQEATIQVDSFPDIPLRAKVAKIAHQSIIKNSINIYQVQLKSEKIPPEFRAGLTATIYFLQEDKEGALVLPTWVAEGRENFSLNLNVKLGNGQMESRKVRVGPSNGQKIAILEGLAEGDIIVVKEQKLLSEVKPATSPFGGPPRGGAHGGSSRGR